MAASIQANAYVIYASGARAMLAQPVLVEADIALSMLTPLAAPFSCGDHIHECPNVAPRRQYGPDIWLVGQDPSWAGQTHRYAHGNGSRDRSGRALQ